MTVNRPNAVSKKVVFLLLPKVHLLDFAGPAQVLYEANQLLQTNFRLQFCGLEAQLQSEQGVFFGNLQPFREVELKAGDLICIPGIDFASFVKGEFQAAVSKLKDWLWQHHQQGVLLSSVCTGALILAEAGLLDYKKCTTHWKCIDFMEKQYPKARVQINRLFVEDKGIFTSAGMTSGIDMLLHLLEQWTNPVAAARVAREMVVYIRRKGMDSQQSVYLDYKTHFNPAVHKVQDYLMNHIAENPTLEELANLIHMSSRHLSRIFKEATGQSISDYRNTIRLELARNLLHNPNLTMESIAHQCGFGSDRQFRRVWKQAYGESPKALKS